MQGISGFRIIDTQRHPLSGRAQPQHVTECRPDVCTIWDAYLSTKGVAPADHRKGPINGRAYCGILIWLHHGLNAKENAYC